MGYKNYHGIRRGIVTPARSDLIILFVTKEKVKYAVQYQDRIENNFLIMQGEEKHGNDKRLLANFNGDRKDKIVLFYRDIHHTPFIYYGYVKITKANIHVDKPSEFDFFYWVKIMI